MIRKISKELLNKVEKKYKKENFSLPFSLKPGDTIQILYKISEGSKERTQSYEGILLSKKNSGLSQSITLSRMILGVGLEQVFFLNSPKIINIIKKKESTSRRSKVYFLRHIK